MTLTDKYTNPIEKAEGKIELSSDAYAICEFIEQLIDKLEHARISMHRK